MCEGGAQASGAGLCGPWSVLKPAHQLASCLLDGRASRQRETVFRT